MKYTSTRDTGLTAVAVALFLAAPTVGLAQDYFPEDKSEAVPPQQYSPYVE